MITRVSVAQAAEAACRWYGVDGTAERLAAEHDDTFRLVTADGTARLLKISLVERFGPEPVTFPTAVLLYLAAAAPEVPVQRVIPARDGRPEVAWTDSGTLRLVRMTSWLDGELLVKAHSGAGLRADIGASLGRLNIALRGFSHPGAARTHRWDLQRFDALRGLLAELPADGILPELAAGPAAGRWLRAALGECLDRFDLVVRPLLGIAARQVIHNDFHGHNLLSDGVRITGILDFGDALSGPVAMDVAVAACYQLGSGGDVLGPALDVVAGYHRADPLEDAELALVAEFVVARIAARIIVSQWNAARDPANREYLLRRTPQAIEHFAALRRLPSGEISERLRAACRR